MNDLNKRYSEENLGLPLKVRMGKEQNNCQVYMYGRYYGHGYDGESNIENDDYHLITLVTPGGTLVRGGNIYFDEIKEDDKEDLEKLKNFEEQAEQPYYPFLNIINNKFYKSYEYKKQPLTFKHYPLEWFEEKGYFEIDLDLFGNALSALFTAYFKERYYFNKINYRYEGKSRVGLTYNDIYHSRYMFLLSPKEYQKNITTLFSEHPYQDKYYSDSMFRQKPLFVNEDEYLINFGCFSTPKIKLGEVVKGKFIPNTTYPFNDASHRREINYNNEQFDIAGDFINEIMNYKLQNRKANLNQEDMNIILEKYGISYTDEMNRLVTALKNTNEKVVETLSKNNQIGKVLKLENKGGKRNG